MQQQHAQVREGGSEIRRGCCRRIQRRCCQSVEAVQVVAVRMSFSIVLLPTFAASTRHHFNTFSSPFLSSVLLILIVFFCFLFLCVLFVCYFVILFLFLRCSVLRMLCKVHAHDSRESKHNFDHDWLNWWHVGRAEERLKLTHSDSVAPTTSCLEGRWRNGWRAWLRK